MMECVVEEDEDCQSGGGTMCSFDHYLSTRLKYGPAQKNCTLSLMIMLFSEGSESIVLGLILPVIANEWNMTTMQKSLLITAVYLGATFGSGLQAIADTYGRYKVITLAGVLQVGAGLLSAIAGEFSFFLIIRFVYGAAIGMILPLSGTYIAEVTPHDRRAKEIVNSRVYWSAGTIFTSILCYFLIAEASEPRWRLILVLVCLPGVYSMYVHIVHGRESPRFLLLKGKIEEARAVMSQMEAINKAEPLPFNEFEKMMNWVKSQQRSHGNELPFSNMLAAEYRGTTLKLWMAWWTVCFMYYGTMLLLPLILASHFETTIRLNYIIIILVSLVELLGFYFSYNFMEMPALGRKNTLRGAFAIGAMASLFLLIFNVGPVLLGTMFMVIKFAISIAFLTLYPYTAELYHTLLRSKALGSCSLVGRIGIIFLGTIGVYAIEWLHGRGLYLIFVVLSLTSYLCMTLMPYDTLGKELDAMKPVADDYQRQA